MAAFDEAWRVLKALPEQQAFHADQAEMPIQYQQEKPQYYESRAGTIHPAILGMMERRQMPSRRLDFPDKRMAVEGEKIFDYVHHPLNPKPNSRYGTIMGQGRRQLMTGERRPGEGESDESYELTDAAQKERGSVFDTEHHNKHGLPMVGVRQPKYPYRPES